MKKLWAFLVMAFLFAGGVFAGGGRQADSGGAPKGGQVTITLWDINPGPERTPVSGRGYQVVP